MPGLHTEERMAFDGPGPFDGDSVYNYLDRVSNQPPTTVQAELAAAFQEVIQGGAARHMPAEFASMLGLDSSAVPTVYVDVDEGVWAWACAEMLAAAMGLPPQTPIPEPFHSVAQSVPEPRMLVADALKALDIVGDSKRSELAALLEEAEAEEPRKRMGDLHSTLGHWQLRSI